MKQYTVTLTEEDINTLAEGYGYEVDGVINRIISEAKQEGPQVTLEDAFGHPILVDSKATCPVCEFPKVTRFNIDDHFVAWCPCGCIFTEDEVLQEPSQPPVREWWKSLMQL